MRTKVIDVYTDGSYHDLSGYKDKTYGAIYVPSFDEKEWQFFTTKQHYVGSRNVGGEILAAEFAMSLISRLYDADASNEPIHYTVNLYADYEGVVKWITGEWRAKKVLTQKYRSYIAKLLDGRDIKLNLSWIRGHAGDPGNEKADILATEAYHSERCYDANSFVEDVLK